jgi:hypothetical protein
MTFVVEEEFEDTKGIIDRYTVINIPVCEIKGSSFMNLLISYKLLKKLRLI